MTSSGSYDPSHCADTSYGQARDGYSMGLKAVLTDKETGKRLNGSAGMSTSYAGGGLSTGEKYSCMEKADDESVIVYAYSKGYAPQAAVIAPPKGRMAEITIRLSKSCSGGPTCFDNIRTAYTNKSQAAEMVIAAQQTFDWHINETFGLEKDDYTLSCT